MSDKKCPFCGEPRTRSSIPGDKFACGTLGPDINGEYSTGHVCDIHTFTKVIRELEARLAAAEAAARWLYTMAEEHPSLTAQSRWPWLSKEDTP